MDSASRLSLKYKLLWVGLFAVTMGYFEAALVEYLRELYYPDGFQFPLKDIPLRLIQIELGREAASIFMMIAVAGIAARLFIDRFAVFCYCFGVWDITYYLFLRLFEGWPLSLGTIDLLFLIPLPWIGPVWAPVAVSIALIWAAVHIWNSLDHGLILRPSWFEWLLEIFAGMIIIASFLAGAPAALKKTELPQFPWLIWLAGMILGLVIFYRALHRTHSLESS